MAIRAFELKDGDLLLIDEEHPHQTIAAYVLEAHPEARHDALRLLSHQIQRVAEKRDEERAKTPDAVFERRALFAYLETEVGRMLGSFGPAVLKQLFEMIEAALPHHRKPGK